MSETAITGQVLSPDGWPVPDAIATVTDAAGRQVARISVDSDGALIVPGLRPGGHIVIVSSAGRRPLARTVMVHEGRTTELGLLELPSADGLAMPQPGVWAFDPAHSAVQATALHLGISKVKGWFRGFEGSVVVADPPENSSVEVTIDTASIATHNEQRDEHLRSADFLDVERFPTITFKSDTIERTGADRWAMTGPFTMRDITRTVRLDVVYLGTSQDPWGGVRAGFAATAQLDRDDFAMIWNRSPAIGIAVFGRTLKIDIDIQAVLRQ
ncbi:MAG: hypothetical protein GEV11_22770 [Streptosporangiales bacterium]|nr:hypothetical protein [Streptosporangiales bacterium]